MKTFLAAALLVLSAIATAQEVTKPVTIALEPLGDDEHGVVGSVSFVFANPRRITDAGLFLEGSIAQSGRVPRNFRFAVPREDDKMFWSNSFARNGKVVRETRWTLLPDQRNQMAMVHSFVPGEVEIEARLVLEGDRDAPATLVARTTETFTIAKTKRPFALVIEEDAPSAPKVEEPTGAVTIRFPHRKNASTLIPVSADVLPPVKRVEFWVDEKRVLARNAPPYTTEVDLGSAQESVTLRAIGYDAAGRYVDADAFVLNDADAPIGVKITRVTTADSIHFKLSVRNPNGTRLKSVALYAGDRKLHEWERPPYALSIPISSLGDVDSVRASVIDENGYEALDVHMLMSAAPR